MRKPRLILGLLALLAILILSMGVVGLKYIESDSFRIWLGGKLSESLGRQTRFAQNLQVTPGLTPGLHIQGLTIANPDWAGQPNFLQVDEITLAPRLLPLLTGYLVFNLVSAKGGEIWLEQGENGAVSWPTGDSDNTSDDSAIRLRTINRAEFSNFVITLAGKDGLQLKLDQVSGNLEVDRSVSPMRITGDLQSDQISVGGDAEKSDGKPNDKLVPSHALPTAWLDTFQADICWNIGTLNLGALSLRALRTRAQLENGRLKLDPIDAKIGDTPLHMRMAFARSGERASLRASGELDDLDLSENVRWLRGNDPGEGYLDMRFVVDGVGNSTDEIAAALNGNLQLVMEEGQVSNSWLQRVTSDLGSLINPWSSIEGETPVRCLAVRLKADTGQVNIEQMVLDTRNALILGEGSINLGTEEVSIILSPDTRSLDLLKLQLPIRISGSLTNLDADPAPTAIITKSGTSILRNIASAGGLLGDDLKDQLGSSSAGCQASLEAYRGTDEDTAEGDSSTGKNQATSP